MITYNTLKGRGALKKFESIWNISLMKWTKLPSFTRWSKIADELQEMKDESEIITMGVGTTQETKRLVLS